jgi:starch phosphorylase
MTPKPRFVLILRILINFTSWRNGEDVAYSPDLPIAFFSAEYGLHHSLPFYAGGLGFLAGDLLKECSDLGIPVVAVGFMYPEGYLGSFSSPKISQAF